MAPPRQLPALTDDLLDEIFVRIGCPAALTRASAASVAFRHLITDPSFRRRYRSRHRPLLLGFLSVHPSMGFHPVQAPHPNAPAARALANISFDYLPTGKSHHWSICDVRDGRVLFVCSGAADYRVPPDFAVSDPLSRQYLMLPAMPCYDKHDLDVFDAGFAPSCEEDYDETTSFRVVVMMRNYTKLVVLVFDSGCSSWTVSRPSVNLDGLNLISSELEERPLLLRPHYAYGSFYWNVVVENLQMNKLLKLDINRMEFSTVDLPIGQDMQHVTIVEAGEGRLGMFRFTHDRKFLNYYCYNSMQNEAERANEWQMKNVIPLAVHGNVWIVGASQSYVFLHGERKVQDSMCRTIYSLGIKTMKIDMVGHTSSPYFRGHLYFGFPPSMSPRRI